MNKRPVVLIAFEEYDNLGTGYLASVLSDGGFETLVIDVRNDKKEILLNLLDANPSIVGFSIIFQFYIYAFADLISYLRKGGVSCHFTSGGQYASLRYKELFEIVPELDSIVRFEGEYTLLELVRCINSGTDWRLIKNIAYKVNNNPLITPLRPIEMDLDNFPYPMRSPMKEYAYGKMFCTLLAGRGCIYNCIYCNTRKFFESQQGPIKRLRSPELVVEEIDQLYHKKNCSVFLFQDDDFPVITKHKNDWIKRFCNEIDRKELTGKIMWKINCRPDEISYDSFALMKDKGLFLVFIGIEDGTNAGLTLLNKHMTVEQSLRGINILKKLGLGFDFGFMLFQPQSTFSTIQENLNFLSQICSDGYSPVNFFKMLPFFETELERKLKIEERLTGKPGFLDYTFLDEYLNHYYDFFEDSFMAWLRSPEGLLNISRWARNFVLVYSFFFKPTSEIKILSGKIVDTISNSNNSLLNIMKELADQFGSGYYSNGNHADELKKYKQKISRQHAYLKRKINNCLDQLLNVSESIQELSCFA
jgi:radical SAM superfamily enzyme YgiQ (UPF0313 family)